jgi:hypothetical protein
MEDRKHHSSVEAPRAYTEIRLQVLQDIRSGARIGKN